MVKIQHQSPALKHIEIGLLDDFKKADKGTTTVIMKTEDKIREADRYYLMKEKTTIDYHHPRYQKLPIESKNSITRYTKENISMK